MFEYFKVDFSSLFSEWQPYCTFAFMLDFIDIMALENQQPCLSLLCQGLNEDCHNCPCILIDRYYNFLFNPRCIILHTQTASCSRYIVLVVTKIWYTLVHQTGNHWLNLYMFYDFPQQFRIHESLPLRLHCYYFSWEMNRYKYCL